MKMKEENCFPANCQNPFFLFWAFFRPKKVLCSGESYMKKLKSAEEKIGRMSIKESLAKAGRIKVSQHKDKTWHANITVKKNADMFQEMGVDISGDLKKLALPIY